MALRGLISRSCRSFSLISSFEDTAVERLDQLRNKIKHETYGLPWSFTGYPSKQPMMRYMPDRNLIQNKLSIMAYLAHFYSMYTQVVTALAAGDLTPVSDLLEDNLRLKLELRLKELHREGKSLVVKENLDYVRDNPKPVVNVHDAVIYRGLSHKRSENEYMDNYHVYTDKDLGLVCFTHQHLSEQYAYVDQKRLEGLLQRNNWCLLQYLVHLKTPLQLYLVGNNKKTVSEYDKRYTFGQEWIFESQMSPGPPMKNEDKSESYMEWIVKHTATTWRISDMAEFMQGNPLTIKAPPKDQPPADKQQASNAEGA